MSNRTVFTRTSRLLALVFFVSVYSIAVLSTVDDASIVLNREITIVPIIAAKITSSLFFWFMPVVVLLVYHYFQYHLVVLKTASSKHHSYKAEADHSEADSIFADLLSIQLRRHEKFTNYAGTVLSYLAVWVVAPLTILAGWIRYLPRHDVLVSDYQVMVLWLLLAPPVVTRSFRRSARGWANRLLLLSITSAVLVMLL